MSNKGSDKNVENIERLNNFIEAYKQTKEQSFIVDSINKDFFFEFVDCLLAEREQKDKRIKELEEESRKKSIELICYQEELENSIPKQVVIDKIKEIVRLRDKCITAEGNNIMNGEIIVLQELLEGEK